MKSQVLLFLFFLITTTTHAQPFNPNYHWLQGRSAATDKVLYLLTCMDKTPGVKEALKKCEPLQMIRARQQAKRTETAACKTDLDCLSAKFLWTEEDINQAGKSLETYYTNTLALQKMVKQEMRPSGAFYQFQNLSDAQMLDSAWVQTLHGLNHIIRVYALGETPTFGRIDSIAFAKDDAFFKRLTEIMANYTVSISDTMAVYEPSLLFALRLLEFNNRDEAGRFERLNLTENRACSTAVQHINWKNYPYALILVPGSGNEKENIRLSPMGKLRLAMAVDAFRAGQAPFIAVSGGFVHPYQTPYCEAMEMKNYLMSFYGIPESKILIDPHARHTTSNLRDVARLMFYYQFPEEKKSLIITDPSQGSYILDARFATNCQRDLHCIPFSDLKSLDPYRIEWRPVRCALHLQPDDPLDP